MFEDEARIASQLEHPYIARCLDFGHVDGDWYIAFEYVDGKDLRALFDRCVKTGEPPPLPVPALRLRRASPRGWRTRTRARTRAARPVSIVHRDVSPQNIIVSFDGDVKLIDFGIAKAAGKLSRTQVGTIKGKFGYMAPEQVRGPRGRRCAPTSSRWGSACGSSSRSSASSRPRTSSWSSRRCDSLQVEPPSRYAPGVPARARPHRPQGARKGPGRALPCS